jgi:hypothetical protein
MSDATVRMPIFMPPEGAPKVLKAVNAVMRDIPNIEKTGNNKEQKYRYVEATVLTARVQDAMIKHNLVLSMREISRAVTGGILFIKFEFDAFCDDQAILNIGSFSGACRFQFKAGTYDDKAANKCSTTALKNYQIILFRIPADVDDIERDDEARPPPGRGNGRDDDPDARSARDREDRGFDGPPDDERPPAWEAGEVASAPPPNDEPPDDAGPADFQDRVRGLASKLKGVYSRAEADALWQEHAAMLRQCSDTTFNWLSDAYEGRWDIKPPAV